MSHKVVSLVYSRRVGSAHRKAILAYMADRASDNGQGIFCSKGTIADETEIARSTVFKTIRDLVTEGVLIEAGHRPCRNGATVVYDLNLDAIRAFEGVDGSGHNQSARRTPTGPGAGPVRDVTSPPDGPHQSGGRTPTSPSAGPKPSLEPSLNTEAAEGACARNPPRSPGEVIDRITHALGFDTRGIVPKYWAGADAPVIVGRWMTELHLTPDEIVRVAQANAVQHGSPAQGPKILTQHMASFAEAKTAPMAPSQPVRASPPPGKTNRELGEIAMAKLEEQNRLRATR